MGKQKERDDDYHHSKPKEYVFCVSIGRDDSCRKHESDKGRFLLRLPERETSFFLESDVRHICERYRY